MYLRLDRVDALVEALQAVRDNTQLCVTEIRHVSATALPETQSLVRERIAVCEEKIERLLASADAQSSQTTAPDYWEERVQQARARKAKLLSFGPNARGLLVTTKHGLFAVDPEDGGGGATLLHEGCYNEPEYMLARSLISKEGDVLVVGAHIGEHVVPLSRDCNKLVAIEANPHTYEYLKTNLILNSCTNVVSYNIAAGEKIEKIKFLLNTENSGGSKRMPVSAQFPYTYDNPEVIEIDSAPLDTVLIDQGDFDLIMMDIEGSEFFALKGMPRILSRSKALSVEFLPHHIAWVSGVQVDDFIGAILPHFNWMYVPSYQQVVPKNEMLKKIQEIYQANEGHDGIYFLKEISPNWLESVGVIQKSLLVKIEPEPTVS
jgi:FkbM family methyltransferase